ncbi:MAG: hypothetical protein GC201_13640 [Alphaproteobacteria bacterium]|nr:hypothetical protein [Alphaproteobacteria bacterium]
MNYLLFVFLLIGVLALFQVLRARSSPSHRTLPEKPPLWRGLSVPMRLLVIGLIAAWAVGLALLLVDGHLEIVALTQPAIAVGPYRHPLMIKGAVRYLTDSQERTYAMVHYFMLGSLATTLALAAVYKTVVCRQEAKERQAKVRRLLGEK